MKTIKKNMIKYNNEKIFAKNLLQSCDCNIPRTCCPNDKENVNNLDDLTLCETKFCGIIDQTLFYIDLTVLYIQNFENFT